MSLIQCGECRQEVSSQAPTCPHCGNPINTESLARPEKRSTVATPVPNEPSRQRSSLQSENLLDIAKAQKSVQWMILLAIAGLVAGIWFPLVPLTVGLIQLFFVYRLASALHAMAWLYAAVCLIPVIGLFSLLHLNGMATKTLQAAGLKVGLMGVSEKRIRKLEQSVSEIAGARSKPLPKALGGLLIPVMILGAVYAPKLYMSASPPPPLSLVFRPSAVSSGRVLMVTNASNQPVYECTIRIEASSGRTLGPIVYAVVQKPNQTLELGWMELDWSFEPGEVVTITAKDYSKPVKTIVP